MFQKDLPINERIFQGTKYQFLVLSRADIKSFISEIPYLIISVTDPEKDEAVFSESPYLCAVLRNKFHDVGKALRQLETETNAATDISMNDQDAKQILSFVTVHLSKVNLIVCQCEQGVSRSAAIAAALSRILQNEDEFFFRHYWVNRWVYDLLLANADVLQNPI